MASGNKLIGLIGYPLGHSFSNKYFTDKFDKEGIEGYTHRNFELETADALPGLIKAHPELIGLNVTIPHKVNVIPCLDHLDATANSIGAVNTIRIQDGILEGFNTDHYGFAESLRSWAGPSLKTMKRALILGTGGASKAVQVALNDLGLKVRYVSRSAGADNYTYDQLIEQPEVLEEYHLIVNCTPLGTFPDIDSKPRIPYEVLGKNHYLYDLVYNPEQTAFLSAGRERGAHIKNGLQMLHLQAEKSWEIWMGAF
ncbi:MAG: shikimate dehydrogenase [Cyclobacteriaceae bacterium]